MCVVVEDDVGQLELAAALDIHLPITVDEDVGDRGIGEQRLERTQSQHFVLDVPDEAAPLDIVDDDVFGFEQPLDQVPELLLQALRREIFHRLQVDLIQKRLVDVSLELGILFLVDAHRSLGRNCDAKGLVSDGVQPVSQ